MRRRLASGAGVLPYNRLAAIALICAAVLPTGLLGALVYRQVDNALAQDALVETDRAVAAAMLHTRQVQADLDALASSYATWPVFQRMVASGDLTLAHDEVVAFLVGQGSAAAGRVDLMSGAAASANPAAAASVPSSTASRDPAASTASVFAGDPTVAAALASVHPNTNGNPTVIAVDSAVYLATSRVITDPNAPSNPIGEIALARRMDALFTTNLATLTGYSVTLTDPSGAAVVATDPATSAAAIAATAGSGDVVREGDVVAERAHLDGPAGGADLVLSSRVSALQATAGGLPLLILGLLVVTALIALLLAGLLARILGRRLGVVHDALAAVADGRVPPSHGYRQDDDIARLAAGLDRLVAALDRREMVLRRSLAAASAVPIHLSAAEAGRALAEAARDIFGLSFVRIVEPGGSVLAAAGEGPAVGGEQRLVEAAAGLGADGRRLEAGLPKAAAWSDGDQASFEVMALLAGSVVAEAEQYGVAAGRAERLDRLNRLQREFLRGVSHNLRAPLATIELAASDLLDRAPDPFVRLRAEAIRVEERRLARLVSQVLLLSRMESGTLELEGEPVALAPLARRVAAELGLADRVVLRELAAGAVAITDEAATEQIVWILLDNAARYAPSGVIVVEVLPADTLNADPAIVLAVQDEGPGVAPTDERRIFRRFARGRSSAGTEGSGVGLSVARGLARALGGDVVYRAGAAARGARFEVSLPSSGPAVEAETS